MSVSPSSELLSGIAANWWSFVIRGVLALIFALIAAFMPGITLLALVLLFAAYALVQGVFSIIAAVRGTRPQVRWWVLLVEGIVGILAGVIAFVWPGLTALALLMVIAAWAIMTGVLEIIAAVRLRKEIRGEWLLALSGAISIVFGILLFLFPGSGALAVIWILAAYAVVFGVLMIALGLKLRRFAPHTDERHMGGVAPGY